MATQILAASRRRSTGVAPDHIGLDQHRKTEPSSDGDLETVRREIPLLERPPAAGLVD